MWQKAKNYLIIGTGIIAMVLFIMLRLKSSRLVKLVMASERAKLDNKLANISKEKEKLRAKGKKIGSDLKKVEKDLEKQKKKVEKISNNSDVDLVALQKFFNDVLK